MIFSKLNFRFKQLSSNISLPHPFFHGFRLSEGWLYGDEKAQKGLEVLVDPDVVWPVAQTLVHVTKQHWWGVHTKCAINLKQSFFYSAGPGYPTLEQPVINFWIKLFM